ncbi:O-antigen ligase family protein [Noviherbaspirillum sp. CPCC 100848]|uniref:O-antigen ligase family protein n=1 Tax=Noviherbaspirillum album TaxID=3080276 RepID=A0ABU6J6L5_9BURK|nr:O-antigen ligase family protein [Noviherbaspirillum sp. CPCC 100848]MEC4719289.1 O-antigen ligase family protein [Noviherbaspirillum sp. CPCC 100848]
MNHGLSEMHPIAAATPAYAHRRLPSSAASSFVEHYVAAALATVLVLIFLNLPNYANALSKSLAPKYFYVGFLVMLLPLLLRFRTWVTYLLSPFALWAFVAVSFNAVYWYGASADGSVFRAELISTRIQTLIFAVVLGMCFANVRSSRFEKIFPLLAVALPVMVFVDFLAPGLFYPVDIDGAVRGRSAATLINPTTAGEVMLVLFLLACPVLKRSTRTVLLLVVGAGIFLTFSRSAILAWLILWIVLAFTRVLPRSALILLLAVSAAAPVLMASMQIYFETRHDFSPALIDLQQRLNFFTSGGLKDGSALERSAVLSDGWQTFINNMVVGAGPGATESWPHAIGSVGPHNQFVLLAAEYGMFGIAMWISLALIIWNGRYFKDRALQQSMCLLFVLMTMFTHNMFDFQFWLLTFALVSGRRIE